MDYFLNITDLGEVVVRAFVHALPHDYEHLLHVADDHLHHLHQMLLLVGIHHDLGNIDNAGFQRSLMIIIHFFEIQDVVVEIIHFFEIEDVVLEIIHFFEIQDVVVFTLSLFIIFLRLH